MGCTVRGGGGGGGWRSESGEPSGGERSVGCTVLGDWWGGGGGAVHFPLEN